MCNYAIVHFLTCVFVHSLQETPLPMNDAKGRYFPGNYCQTQEELDEIFESQPRTIHATKVRQFGHRFGLLASNWLGWQQQWSDAQHGSSYVSTAVPKSCKPHILLSTKLSILGEYTGNRGKENREHQRSRYGMDPFCEIGKDKEGCSLEESNCLGTFIIPLGHSKTIYLHAPHVNHVKVSRGEMLFVSRGTPFGEMVHTQYKTHISYRPTLYVKAYSKLMKPHQREICYPEPPIGYYPPAFYQHMIPEDVYKCVQVFFPHFESLFRVPGVPFRAITEEAIVRLGSFVHGQRMLVETDAGPDDAYVSSGDELSDGEITEYIPDPDLLVGPKHNRAPEVDFVSKKKAKKKKKKRRKRRMDNSFSHNSGSEDEDGEDEVPRKKSRKARAPPPNQEANDGEEDPEVEERRTKKPRKAKAPPPNQEANVEKPKARQRKGRPKVNEENKEEEEAVGATGKPYRHNPNRTKVTRRKMTPGFKRRNKIPTVPRGKPPTHLLFADSLCLTNKNTIV